MLSAFRDEIIDAQKGRSDLLKWKLILVAALGTFGLGLNHPPSDRAYLVTTNNPWEVLSTSLLLCLIPLACVYVDSLCRHLYLRILVISVFFRHYNYREGSELDWFCEYERFCEMTRTKDVKPLRDTTTHHKKGNSEIKPFSLEDLAMEGATILLSVVVLCFAISLWGDVNSFCKKHVCENIEHLVPIEYLVPMVIGGSGFVGIAFSIYIKKRFRRTDAQLSNNAREFIRKIIRDRNNRSHSMLGPSGNQINNYTVKELIVSEYDSAKLAAIWQFLKAKGALTFETTNHLFPAAATADSKNTGYKHVWVRDNIYVAYAHYVMGEHEIATETLTRLMAYFKKFSFRFTDIIENPEVKEQVMKRPNIRFDGEKMQELDEPWEHAQNDALGYFVWLYCKLANEQSANTPQLPLEKEDSLMLLRFLLYFKATRYWEDADSGHWEEGRKVSASSIGPVIAGLKALNTLITSHEIELQELEDPDCTTVINQLISNGEAALNEILPWECRTLEHERRYDAALLYLIYPLNVVSKAQAKTILADVKEALTGDYGIQRYPYDSFWCRDFQDLEKSIQTAQYSGREAWLKKHHRAVKRGEEAQWCIFDPIISAIYGEWFQESGEAKYLALQTHHLNRALGQITGDGNTVDAGKGNNKPVDIPAYRCPELYYLQHDEYVPNVSTPLLWTQANLCIALKLMERSLA